MHFYYEELVFGEFNMLFTIVIKDAEVNGFSKTADAPRCWAAGKHEFPTIAFPPPDITMIFTFGHRRLSSMTNSIPSILGMIKSVNTRAMEGSNKLRATLPSVARITSKPARVKVCLNIPPN